MTEKEKVVVQSGPIQIVPGRVVSVLAPKEFEDKNGRKFKSRAMLFVALDGEVWLLSVSGRQMSRLDDFKRGDIVIIRDPYKVDPETKRVVLGYRGTLLKGTEEHEKAYNIPELKGTGRRSYVDIATAYDMYQKGERKYFDTIATIYAVRGAITYESKGDKHILLRIGLEDETKAMLALWFRAENILEDLGITYEAVEEKYTQAKEKAKSDDSVKPAKVAAEIFENLVGRYVEVSYTFGEEEMPSGEKIPVMNILSLKLPDEATLQNLLGKGGDEA